MSSLVIDFARDAPLRPFGDDTAGMAIMGTDIGCPAHALHVLLVEDSISDAELTVEMLEEGLAGVSVRHVTCLADAVEVLQRDVVDVALLDLGLPDAHDLQALQALRLVAPALAAVVVLTGRDEDVLALAALEAGAQDYLLKDGLTPTVLARSVRYAMSRMRGERDLASSRAWAQSVLDSIDAPTCAVDPTGVITAVNAAWTRFAADNGGDPAASGMGVNYLSVCTSSPDPLAVALAEDLRRLLSAGVGRVELDYPCHSPSSRRWFSLRVTPVAGGGGAVLTHLDVTALRLAQEQLDFAASHDPLTGLLTRRGLVHDLDRRLQAVPAGRAVAVFFIDLDRFKLINDTLGHTSTRSP
jgi:CheY-like chemotaxis protein